MSCLFIGKLIGTPFRDGHDVVYDVRPRVEVVLDGVVDRTAADAAGWFVAGDGFSVAVADGGVAWHLGQNPGCPL